MAIQSEFSGFLNALASGNGLDSAIDGLVAKYGTTASSNGASAGQILNASNAFKQAISDAISQGLSAEAAFEHALGIFWANIEILSETNTASPEQKLLAALASEDSVQKILEAIKLTTANGEGDLLEAKFIDVLVEQLASGQSVADAILTALQTSELATNVAKGEQEFIEANKIGQLLSALTSGHSLEQAIEDLSDNGDAGGFEKTLSQSLQEGLAMDEASESAQEMSQQLSEAEANAKENIVTALATGEDLGDKLGNAGGDPEGFEKALAQSLQEGLTPDEASALAEDMAQQLTEAETNAKDSLVSALATGEDLGNQLGDSGSFEKALAQNLQAGVAPDQASALAKDTAQQVAQAVADAPDSLVTALANGENLGNSGGDSENFEKALAQNLQSGIAPEQAAALAQDTAKQVAEAVANAPVTQATALATGQNLGPVTTATNDTAGQNGDSGTNPTSGNTEQQVAALVPAPVSAPEVQQSQNPLTKTTTNNLNSPPPSSQSPTADGPPPVVEPTIQQTQVQTTSTDGQEETTQPDPVNNVTTPTGAGGQNSPESPVAPEVQPSIDNSPNTGSDSPPPNVEVASADTAPDSEPQAPAPPPGVTPTPILASFSNPFAYNPFGVSADGSTGNSSSGLGNSPFVAKLPAPAPVFVSASVRQSVARTTQPPSSSDETVTQPVVVAKVIAPANVAPTTSLVIGAGLEDAASISLALSGSDTDGSVARFKILNLPSNGTLYSDAGLNNPISVNGTVSAAANGAIVYFVPAANYSGTLSFKYTSIDNEGLVDASSATAIIRVTSSNDAPIANVDSGTTDENASIAINVLANDSDVDAGDTLTVDAVTITSGNGSVSIVGNQVVWNPGTDYDYLAVGETATVALAYDMSDNNGGTDSSTVTITVTGSNDGPIASVDSGTTNENASITIDVLSNDSDVDVSDTHTVDAVSITTGNGSASIVANQVVWNPGTDYDYLAVGETATVVLAYDVSDNNGGADSSTVSITVTGSNDAPIANVDSGTTDENASITIDVLGNDSDVDVSDTHTVDAVSITSGNGSASIVANQVVWNPGTDYDYLSVGETATVNLAYDMSDNNGGTDSSTVSITVTGSNDAAKVSFALQDSGFENYDVSASSGNFELHGAFTNYTGAWTFTGHSGVTAENSADYSQNINIVSGDQAAILQSNHSSGTSSIGQTFVAGPGQYEITFEVARSSLYLGHGSITQIPTTFDVVIDGVIAQSVTVGIDAAAQIFSQITLNVTLPSNASGEHTVQFVTHETFVSAVLIDQVAITAVSNTTISEDAAQNTVSGNLYNSDVDNTNDVWQASTGAGGNGFGTFTMNTAGAWVYTLDNSNTTVNALNNGQTATDTFTVATADGTQTTVNITINGTNDAAAIQLDTTTIALQNANFETPDIYPFVKGATASAGSGWTFNDSAGLTVESSINPFTQQAGKSPGGVGETQVALLQNDSPSPDGQVSQDFTGEAGRYTIEFDASERYAGSIGKIDVLIDGVLVTLNGVDVGHAINDTTFSEYQRHSITFDIATSGTHTLTFSAAAGHPNIDNITLVGKEEYKVALTEDAAQNTVSGNLDHTDVDNTDDVWQVVNSGTASIGGFGTYEVDATGGWTYTLDNSNTTVNALNNGQTATDTFTVATSDGTQTTVHVTINGATDLVYAVPAKITVSEGQQEDYLGSGVGISDDSSVIVSSAPGKDDGKIYVFDGNGQITTEITTPASSNSHSFSSNIAVSGDGSTIVASHGFQDGRIGAIYVMNSDGSGTPVQLVPTGANIYYHFSNSPDISDNGNVIVAGASDVNQAFIFSRTSGGVWSQQIVLTNPESIGGYFGNQMAISGDGSKIIISNPYGANNGKASSGAVYIYDYNPVTNSIGSPVELVQSNTGVNFTFGSDVAISDDGGIAVVGSSGDNLQGDSTGAAYIFDLTGNPPSQIAKLTPHDGVGNDGFGRNVAISGDGSTIVVASPSDDNTPSSVYVYNGSGTLITKLTGPGPNNGGGDNFGTSVDISYDGSAIVVGATQDDDATNNAGATYTFVRQSDGSYNGAVGATTTNYPLYTGPDPIVLDLDGDGIDLSANVAFDLNNDGTAEQMGWAGPNEGLLVADLDNSGAIENGSEVFSPWFGSGGYDDAMSALASLDSNSDGVLDTDDLSFNEIRVWVDGNSDGISQVDELTSLSEQGITSISLAAEAVNYTIDGQKVLAEGQFSLASGETHQYVAVEFAQTEKSNPSVTENSQISVNGTLNKTGVSDSWQAISSAASSNKGFGTYIVNAAGEWVYSLDDTNTIVQALKAGQTETDTFNVLSDDGTPTTVDITIHGANDAPTLPGNQVLTLDGVDDVAVTENLASNQSDNTTLEGWFNWDGSGSVTQILAYNGNVTTSGYGLQGEILDGQLQLDILLGGNAVLSTDASLSQNEWHHVALTRNAGEFELYLDGVQQTVTDSDTSPNSFQSDDVTMIGGAATSNGFAFSGKIDEVRIWDTARSAPEISGIMNQSANGNEAGLTAQWTFDGNGDDLSGNGNAATLQNGADYEDQMNATISAGATFRALLLGTDADSADLQYSLNSNANNGNVSHTNNGAEFIYANNGTVGVDGFSVDVSDGDLNTVETINITVI